MIKSNHHRIQRKKHFKTTADSHIELITMSSCVDRVTNFNIHRLVCFVIFAIGFHYGKCRDEDKIMKGNVNLYCVIQENMLVSDHQRIVPLKC